MHDGFETPHYPVTDETVQIDQPNPEEFKKLKESVQTMTKELTLLATEVREKKEIILMLEKQVKDKTNENKQKVGRISQQKIDAEKDRNEEKEKNEQLLINLQLVSKEKQVLKEENEVLVENSNQLKNNLKQAMEKLKKTELKLQKSSENVDELVGAVRERAEEVTAKEDEILVLGKKLEIENNNNKQMVKNISQLRDENAQVKNKLKAMEQNSESSHITPDFLTEYQDFKKFITKKISHLSEQICKSSQPTSQPTKESISTERKTKDHSRRAKTADNKKRKQYKPRLNNTDYDPVRSTVCDDSNITESMESSDDDESIEVYHESNPHIPIRPGMHSSYSRAVDKQDDRYKKSAKDSAKGPVQGKTLIISTSMTRDIKAERFNEVYENGVAEFKRYRGGKTRNIKEDISKNMKGGSYDRAIVHIGGNDLQDGYHPSLLRKLANDIIETGKICKERGAKNVFIAGVTIRKYEYTWDRCKLLNWELRELCLANGFSFIDNSNISLSNLQDDVHLNDSGTTLLANNYLYFLNRKSGKNA